MKQKHTILVLAAFGLAMGLATLSACGSAARTDEGAAESTASARPETETEESVERSAAPESVPAAARSTGTAAGDAEAQAGSDETTPSVPEYTGLTIPRNPSDNGIEKLATFTYEHEAEGVLQFPDKGIEEAALAWVEGIWRERPLDLNLGSLYVFVHRFSVSEAAFLEQNEGFSLRYPEEVIRDLYALDLLAFNEKYASPWMVRVGEHLYHPVHLAWLKDEEWALLGVTKEAIRASLDALEAISPRMAEAYRARFGTRLD